MAFPEDFFYTKEHEWLSGKTGQIKIGITEYAVDQLGDIVHVDLPSVGDEFQEGDSFGTIESTKTVSDLYMPADGKILEINQSVINNPEGIQEAPYDNGWLVQVELTSPAEALSASEYEDFTKES